MVRRTYYLAADVDEVVENIRQRAGLKKKLVNRSEVIRAALAALQDASTSEIQRLLDKIPRMKLGRPPAES